MLILISMLISSTLGASVYVVTPERPAFLPTPVPEIKNSSYGRNKTSSDLIIAEFKPQAVDSSGKTAGSMSSVRDMLNKEVISSTTIKPWAKVEDVWHVIQHDQEQQIEDLKEEKKKEKNYVETIPSVSMSWDSKFPGNGLVNITAEKPKLIMADIKTEEEERPRNIKTQDSWGYSYQNVGSQNEENYYPSMTYESNAQDRFNPAQPYLPPKPSAQRPSPPKPQPSLPPPPVPMPPPPPPAPPKQVMSAPPMNYESFPPYPPSSSDDSGPPSDFPEYPSHPDDHHHDHDHYKYVEHDHDIHLSDIDLDSLKHFYHDHLHHHEAPPPPPPPPPPTTPKPDMEDKRVNNRYSYYYLGKKLWYLPLYFSVYFIVYVAVLIIKSIARHKITYPQHWKTRRSLNEGWTMPAEEMNILTKFVRDAIINYGIKYLTNKS